MGNIHMTAVNDYEYVGVLEGAEGLPEPECTIWGLYKFPNFWGLLMHLQKKRAVWI